MKHGRNCHICVSESLVEADFACRRRRNKSHVKTLIAAAKAVLNRTRFDTLLTIWVDLHSFGQHCIVYRQFEPWRHELHIPCTRAPKRTSSESPTITKMYSNVAIFSISANSIYSAPSRPPQCGRVYTRPHRAHIFLVRTMYAHKRYYIWQWHIFCTKLTISVRTQDSYARTFVSLRS